MKLCFVYRGAESLGLEYLSAVLKQAGHQTALAFDPGLFGDKRYLNHPVLGRRFDASQAVLDRIVAERPDLVAFSVVTDTYTWACDIARRLKPRLDVPVVFGGIHATSLPERVMANPFVDYALRGECEQALLELVESLQRGQVDTGLRNLCYRDGERVVVNPLRPLLDDLDGLPFPDKALFVDEIPIGPTYWIMTSRGCHFTCSYCHNNIMKRLYGRARYFRNRSPASVIAELRWARQRFDIRTVDFQDDLFTAIPGRILPLLEAYRREIGLPFKCTTHPNCITPEIARALKEAGCRRLMLGVQSMFQPSRDEVLRRPEHNTNVERAFAICDEHRLPFSVDHMFGIPGETEAGHREAARVYARHRSLQRIKCFYLSYYPETEIVDIARERGALSEQDKDTIDAVSGERFFFSQSLMKRDPAMARVARSYEVLFKLMPLLPEAAVQRTLESGLMGALHHVPWVGLLGVEFLIGLKNRDFAMINYARYYGRQIVRSLRRRGAR